ncbi:MAG: preprotein translocase subunit SecG [Acidobacteriia bacterium]|nr:preprotein translocase subunit SecG [Terriglobia bacterium]
MLIALITTVHVIVCAILIVVVLLQHGKSADIAATFGGVGSQTAFGPRGTATLLSRITTWCAIVFMLTAISLTFFASKKGTSSIMENIKSGPTAPPPATPTTPAPAKK